MAKVAHIPYAGASIHSVRRGGGGDGGGGDGSVGGGGTGRAFQDTQGSGPKWDDVAHAWIDENGNEAGPVGSSGRTVYNDGSTPASRNPQAAPPPRNNIMAPMDLQAQARQRQQALIDQLHGIATGQIKSPAQDIYEQQVAQAQNANTSQSSNLRDVGAGGQMHIAEQNANTINQNGMQGGALLQKQQQQQAEQALAQLYQQQREGDLTGAKINAEGILGNNSLNDINDMNNSGNQLTGTLNRYNNLADQGNARLGVSAANAISTRGKVEDVAGAAGGLFGYLQQAGAGNSSSDNRYGENTTNYGNNTGYTSDGKQRGFDIRDNGDK